MPSTAYPYEVWAISQDPSVSQCWSRHRTLDAARRHARRYLRAEISRAIDDRTIYPYEIRVQGDICEFIEAKDL